MGKSGKIFINTLPENIGWWTVKRLFTENVRGVAYIELYKATGRKLTGCGKVEFWDGECAQEALSTQNQWKIGGRWLDLKESPQWRNVQGVIQCDREQGPNIRRWGMA